MATTITLKRSDKFPIGTVVGAYTPVYNRHFGGRPSGAATASATVDATGTLALTGLEADTMYALWGEVGGTNANMQAGTGEFVEPGTLFERIAARRSEVGA